MNQVTEAFEKGIEFAYQKMSEKAYDWILNNLNKFIFVDNNGNILVIESFKEQFYNELKL